MTPYVFLVFLLTSFQVFGSGHTSVWKKKEVDSPRLDINDLRFTNRARCALDSKKPADSAFILINNMEMGKGVYRLAKTTGQNSSRMTKLGIEVFRYSVIQMTNFIHDLLITGNLPLLPVDATLETTPNRYKSLMQSCPSNEYCNELDQYISSVWKSATNAKSVGLARRQVQKRIDNFSNKTSYIFHRSYEQKDKIPHLSCHYLKKFSPLQAHLFGTKPDLSVFELMAKTQANQSEIVARCDDFAAQGDLTVASYQIDLRGVRTKGWNKKGFDYWNSMRLYFSWAFRNAPELNAMAAPFGEVFRGIAIEDSVLFVPNGCKSITPAKCNGDFLSMNTMREFAKENYEKKALDLDTLRLLPLGPQQSLIDDAMTDVNNDILDLGHQDNAEEWLLNYRKNFSATRNVFKKKLISAVNHLNIMSEKMSVQGLISNIRNSFKPLNNFLNGNSTLDAQQVAELKNELFYLCGEFTQAHHEDWSFLKKDLEILKKTTLVDGLSKEIAYKKTQEYFSYYQQLADAILVECNSINQRRVWDKEEFKLERNGFAPWYIEKIQEGKIESNWSERSKALFTAKGKTATLFYGNLIDNDLQFEDVICVTGAECARKVLSSIVDLYSVSKYASTFWSLNQKLKTPSLFNPYSERTACKVYDPWFKTKSIMFSLLTDFSQAALSSVSSGVIFSRFELKPNRVVSFNELVKEGKISFDAKLDKQKVNASLVADFGPMLGVPCAVSVINNSDNPYGIYNFTGVSATMCQSVDDNDLIANSGSDIEDNDNSSRSGCVSCRLNFESVSNAAVGLSRGIGPVYFMVRGLIRLYRGLKDPFNIPRTWEANANNIYETYRRFGKIPKSCLYKLRKGKACLESKCEETLSKRIYDKFNGNIEWMKFNKVSKYTKVKLSSCSEAITVPTYIGSASDDEQFRCVIRKRKSIQVPKHCSGIRKKVKRL